MTTAAAAADYGLVSRHDAGQAVLGPVSLSVLLQTCFLPSAVARSRVRLAGELPRLAVHATLPLVAHLGALRRAYAFFLAPPAAPPPRAAMPLSPSQAALALGWES